VRQVVLQYFKIKCLKYSKCFPEDLIEVRMFLNSKKLNSYRQSLGVAFMVLLLPSCNSGGSAPPSAPICSPGENNNAAMMIDSGKLIAVTSQNKVGAVLYSETRVDDTSAEACTATAVSTSTVLTAAHCLFKPTLGNNNGDVKNAYGRVLNKTFCVSDFSLKRVCSDRVYIDPSYYDPNIDPQKGLDFGFVVFPEGTFSEYFPVARIEVDVADPIVMVGFSPLNISDISQGSKRFGWNQISAIDDFSSFKNPLIFSEYNSTFDAVAANRGDSGGPLLTTSCEIAGIASLRGEVIGQVDGSYHTNLTSSTVSAALYRLWLENGKDGYICGLTGNEQSPCPEIGRNFPTDNPPLVGGDKFPCEAHNLPQSAEPVPQSSCPSK